MADANAISELARIRGLTPSDFVRTVILKALEPMKKRADSTAAAVRALPPEAQERVARARAIRKELDVLRSSRPVTDLLDDVFHDGDGDTVQGNIRSLEAELAELKKAYRGDLLSLKRLADGEVFNLAKPFDEDGDEDGGKSDAGKSDAEEDAEEDAGKTDAEKNAERLIGIEEAIDSLQGVREDRTFLDLLLKGRPVAELLIQEYEYERDCGSPSDEALDDLDEMTEKVLDIRGKIMDLEKAEEGDAAAAAAPVIENLRKELASLREDFLDWRGEKDAAREKAEKEREGPIIWPWNYFQE